MHTETSIRQNWKAIRTRIQEKMFHMKNTILLYDRQNRRSKMSFPFKLVFLFQKMKKKIVDGLSADVYEVLNSI